MDGEGGDDGREMRRRKEPKLPPPMETRGDAEFRGERTESIWGTLMSH
jgi:hypothetical protein